MQVGMVTMVSAGERDVLAGPEGAFAEGFARSE